ncbi:hypothetical protein CMU78_00610 [Elizabethkingia anophelis]|uniref:hypothetical protein n=1 Tax=Elizabethkingia anophelis TaxID=1117645 RepID=UPI00293C2344|nr:hypothetical protein [Elizabethkingia anophelis]MDV3685030.1 hypothetical protein [Elizabethkingia anophelis]MDV3782538.1 hypothetical protein [Elizabethkingia anophelis]MDV3807898.1 hypothetical protein [Elizabethkingia anophelis]MDV3816075.1 hypothetical protein [Elizabethkingia anophelis]
MSKELRLLYVEDDKENRDGLTEALSDEKIGDYILKIDTVDSFDDAFDTIINNNYHIIILDLFKGKPSEGGEEIGLEILKQIQSNSFIPVIFYSGNTKNVEELESQIVGIVTKGGAGIEGLKNEIERLVKFNLPFLKENLHHYIEHELKTYFWDIIHNQRDKFTPDLNDFSLGYLMLRKFGNSLSVEKISEILGNNDLNTDKVHPMEFYLYPTDENIEIESGEILQKDDEIYVVLTPSCDFVKADGRPRKVGKVLLVKTVLLKKTTEYTNYIGNKGKYKQNLSSLIESRKGDRYFFLPGTPFIENRIIDFQSKEMYSYEDLETFTRLAKLDNPYSEAVVASFIRYYNRIGYPDIDSEYVISRL